MLFDCFARDRQIDEIYDLLDKLRRDSNIYDECLRQLHQAVYTEPPEGLFEIKGELNRKIEETKDRVIMSLHFNIGEFIK